MFPYRLHTAGGTTLARRPYAILIKPGEEILFGNGRRFRVLDVVPFEEETGRRSSNYSGSRPLRTRFRMRRLH
jgi:hypothetical protein